MSLLGRFAYRRKKGALVFHGTSEQKEIVERVPDTARHTTPNKAQGGNEVTRIPETPGALLPTPPGHWVGRETRQPAQRRRARILNSSEDEAEAPPSLASVTTPRKKAGLFSDLPLSKRLKRDSTSAHCSAEKQPTSGRLDELGEKKVVEQTQKIQSGSGLSGSGLSRRLFQDNNGAVRGAHISCLVTRGCWM